MNERENEQIFTLSVQRRDIHEWKNFCWCSHWLFFIISCSLPLSPTLTHLHSSALSQTRMRLCVALCVSLCLGLWLDPAGLRRIRKLKWDRGALPHPKTLTKNKRKHETSMLSCQGLNDRLVRFQRAVILKETINYRFVKQNLLIHLFNALFSFLWLTELKKKLGQV